LVNFHKPQNYVEVNARKATSKWIKYKLGLNQQSSFFLFIGLAWDVEVNARKATSKWIKYKLGLNQQSSFFLFIGLAWAI
jgi:RAB protein geranylgeranyltransferase component A